jgi:uncharacterized membrane protein
LKVTLQSYWPLLLLALIPYLLWVQRTTLTGQNVWHLRVAGGVRVAIVLLLTFSLAQPVWHTLGNPIAAVYLLDVSRSVAPESIESALKWIRETNLSANPSNAQFVVFGANPALFGDLSQLENVAVSTDGPVDGSIDQSGTNIQEALNLALRAFPPHHLKRLVLISDGHETSGRMNDVVQQLKQQAIRVYAIPAAARSEGDAWVESMQTPVAIAADEPFTLTVGVYASVDEVGEVEVRTGRHTLGSARQQLKRGLNDITFQTRITQEEGPLTLEAEVRTPTDSFAANNVFRKAVVVHGRPRVLYVESRPDSAAYLREALQLEGFRVDLLPPEDIPTAIDALAVYDVMILSDVARSSLSDRHMNSIATYVRDLGGGIIFSGGENHYGEDGYSQTIIENILPVKFETEPTDPVVVLVVLDRSGSMGGLKMELAKEATKASVGVLKDKDRFGVIGFDNEFYWPVPLQSASNRDGIIELISRIVPGGDTNMYPPMEEAFKHLVDSRREIKHVIVLSDGISLPGDFQGLIRKMSEAKITVSTISVSIGSDRRLLAQIAAWGKGRSYYIEDPGKVPQIFTQETQLASGRTLREESFKPIVLKNIDAFKGIDLESAPPLKGYVATTAKDSAEVILESEKQDPVLARWQYGLGKAAVFTSDLKDRWAAEWLSWKGYGKFWSQLVRETMRPPDSDRFNLRLRRTNDQADITVDAVEPDGQFRNMLRPKVRMIATDQTVVEAPLGQVAPGVYRAALPLTSEGPWIFSATDGLDGVASGAIADSYPDEYHFYPPNEAGLRRLSEDSGGEYEPEASEIFDPLAEMVEIPIPLWPCFSGLALLLYLTDVFLRRRRLFEDRVGTSTGRRTA